MQASVALTCRLSHCGLQALEHRLSCSVTCEIFPGQGSNSCPLHCQADAYPLCHQGSPATLFQLDPFSAVILPASLSLHCRAQFLFPLWVEGRKLPSSVLLIRTRESGRPRLAGHAVPSLSRFHWPMARASSWPGEQRCGEVRVKRGVIRKKTTHSSWKGGWKDKQRSGRKWLNIF